MKSIIIGCVLLTFIIMCQAKSLGNQDYEEKPEDFDIIVNKKNDGLVHYYKPKPGTNDACDKGYCIFGDCYVIHVLGQQKHFCICRENYTGQRCEYATYF
nr:ORF66 [Acipenserid herpesvirus 1]